MSSETQFAINKLTRLSAPNYKEIRASDGLSPIFAGFRRAISREILNDDILGIESNIFTSSLGKINIFVNKHGSRLNAVVDETLFDLRIKISTPKNIGCVSGTCESKERVGFIKIIVDSQSQVEGFWLKESDNLFHLEQIVANSKVFNPDTLRLTQNKNHVRVPGTEIKFLKQIFNINKQEKEISC